MGTVLIVANQTLASPNLATAVADRLAEGATRFHVVVPATPVQHLLTWDEREADDAARARLAAVLERLGELGVEATGEIGCRDPVEAVHDALRRREADEILLSTLPAGMSRWLRQDVPSRLRSSTRVPVTIVTATKVAATSRP